MESREEKVTVLPNPKMNREPTVALCEGCQKIFENHPLPESMILVDVCICYEKPDTKWNNYRKEEEKTDKKTLVYHYNPCPMATHIKHSPKVVKDKKRSGWKKGKAW